ncbi:ABC transporter ATP-binding protein [Paenibacillus thalictri]|uniref:ABC transporter ATP-binding protein n=1 Tax=Paenibacillus thalictri TaxID=2527873 RepID=A0A4Q9DTA6_9BACL|nr:ABC transporter ATP-binding protein [Paenibacillus thalictri]TBL79506.1 ABC transporter ATP-binding protein [Paenibacillus thalictri]
MSKPLLQVNNLSKVFESGVWPRKKTFSAVHDVRFRLSEGEVLAIVGESGSGKSTIARMITRLIPRSGGDIVYNGVSVDDAKLSRELPRHVQMIFQDPFAALNPHHKIGYIIGRALEVQHAGGGDTRSKVISLLNQVGLTPAEDFIDKYPYQLSGGQKQRVIIAKVLGLDPKIIVADEPTSMLDVSIGIGIMNLMLELKEKHRLSYILITHNLGSARYMADRILVMFGGQIVESGPCEEVIADPKHPYTKLLLQSSPDPWRAQQGDAEEPVEPQGGPLPQEGCRFRHRCPHAAQACAAGPIASFRLDEEREVRCVMYG